MRTRFHLLTTLVILTLISGCKTLTSVPYPTKFNSLDSKAASFNNSAPSVKIPDLDSQKYRKNQILRDNDIIVSVSGGGARAAAFTLGVLAELEQLGKWTSPNDNTNALKEIDYFSTVSGGGWGVSAYLASKARHNSTNYSLNENITSIKKGFSEFSDRNIDCLPKELEDHVSKGLKLGDLLYQSEDNILHPYLFVNSTIYSNQSPFVFTKEFIEYYKIEKFLACNGQLSLTAGENFENLPVSYATATSGSVPGFYHNYATTKICDPQGEFYDSFFCAKGRTSLDKLVLVDGGIYDNYGYQTTLEVASQLKSPKTTIIVIDSNADTEIPFESKLDYWKMKIGLGTLMKAGFPSRTSAYKRMFKLTANSMGADVITIDFFSVANILEKLNERDLSNLLSGLETLKLHASTEVYCFADNGDYLDSKSAIKNRGNSYDCRSNNYFRSGLMGKTSYQFDDYYFTLLEELGRLAVRVNAEEIRRIYN